MLLVLFCSPSLTCENMWRDLKRDLSAELPARHRSWNWLQSFANAFPVSPGAKSSEAMLSFVIFVDLQPTAVCTAFQAWHAMAFSTASAALRISRACQAWSLNHLGAQQDAKSARDVRIAVFYEGTTNLTNDNKAQCLLLPDCIHDLG